MWFASFRMQYNASLALMKQAPLRFLSIPVIAAGVGYITNYIGVNMLFYPIEYTGTSFKRWPNQPFGLFGWQGVVPAKRYEMCEIMVDVTLKKLLKISEVFEVLEPQRIADELQSAIQNVLYGGVLPLSIVNYFLRQVATEVIDNIESLVNLGDIVVKGMTADPALLGRFFQTVGRRELTFLVESGTYFGFLLGVAQMFVWMIYPFYWTLPIGGAVVGFLTNWVAIKMIFSPVEPTAVGPFMFQGMFLQRQKEVSAEFSQYLATQLLTSDEIWRYILHDHPASKEQFRSIINVKVPFLTGSMIDRVLETLTKVLVLDTAVKRPGWNEMTAKSVTTLNASSTGTENDITSGIVAATSSGKGREISSILDINTIVEKTPRELFLFLLTAAATPMTPLPPTAQLSLRAAADDSQHKHGLHKYIDHKLGLEDLFVERMNRLTPSEFERILHPIFEEDEPTLIAAGAVLGLLAGGLQWGINVYFDRRNIPATAATAVVVNARSSPNSTGKVVVYRSPQHQSPSSQKHYRTMHTIVRRILFRRYI